MDLTATHTVSRSLFSLRFTAQIEQSVEWMYAFDVHCNSYFLVYLTLYVGNFVIQSCGHLRIVQYICLPLVISEGFIAAILSNTIYLVAVTAYFYSTFLGYEGTNVTLIEISY